MSNHIILSILISSKNDLYDATHWVKSHGFSVRKIHSTKKFHRFRQHTTKYARDRGFDTVRTAKLGKGIEAVIAYRDENEVKLGGGLYDLAKTVIFGRTTYPKEQLRLVEQFGHNTIVSIRIGRTPLPDTIYTALNVLSFGQFSKIMRRSPYDDLYHLFSLVQLSSGTTLLLEKNQAISIRIISNYNPKNTEYIDVPITHPDIQFKTLLDNTQNALGKDYFIYNSISNNCQRFILEMLKSNGLLTEQLQTFIYQDVKTLFNKLNYLQPVVDTLTDLGTKIDILQKGSGRKNCVTDFVVYPTRRIIE
jgi:hypothetical protein